MRKREEIAEEKDLEQREQNRLEGLGKKTKVELHEEKKHNNLFKKNPKLAEKRREWKEAVAQGKAEKKAAHLKFMSDLREGRRIEKNERHMRRAAEMEKITTKDAAAKNKKGKK